jgi:hypothetical protein
MSPVNSIIWTNFVKNARPFEKMLENVKIPCVPAPAVKDVIELIEPKITVVASKVSDYLMYPGKLNFVFLFSRVLPDSDLMN